MKLNTKKIFQFLVEFLLIPWIWILGGYLVILVFFIFYINLEKYSDVSLEVANKLEQGLQISQVMQIFAVLLFVNYTVSFFVSDKYPRIRNIFFLASLFLLFELLLFVWPHFQAGFLQT